MMDAGDKPTEADVRLFCHRACDDYAYARRAAAILCGARDRTYPINRTITQRVMAAIMEFRRTEGRIEAGAP